MEYETVYAFRRDAIPRPVTAPPASDGFWYLASPYTHYPEGLGKACTRACAAAALLIDAGVAVFSPIAHSHTVAINSHLDPLDHDLWMTADRPFMLAARGIVVLMLPGWGESLGIAKETAYFRMAGKPVLYMIAGTVPRELRT